MMHGLARQFMSIAPISMLCPPLADVTGLLCLSLLLLNVCVCVCGDCLDFAPCPVPRAAMASHLPISVRAECTSYTQSAGFANHCENPTQPAGFPAPNAHTPGQGIFPRGHGHLFGRKFVGVFVSLI